MGCNSHLSIEIRGTYSNTLWETWALDIPESRDYILYEKMAGVRGADAAAVVLPRGIPSDASQGVRYWVNRAGDDGHSHSWLYPSEFSTALVKSTYEDDEPRKIWKSLDLVLKSLADVYGDSNVRLVIFFDN